MPMLASQLLRGVILCVETLYQRGRGISCRKDKRERDIAEAFRQYDSGENLPQQGRIYRVKVLSTFLKIGHSYQ